MKRSYVTAFPGRRDHYQIPLSLSENGRLAGFATCFYRERGIIGRVFARTAGVGGRFIDGVSAPKVESMEFVNIAARIGQRILQPSRVGVWEDLAFARRAVALARRRRASLFLYEFQADWAFRQTLNHDAARILFQFHPHPDLEHPLLLADGEIYPRFLAGIRRDTRTNLSAPYRQHTRGAWRHADHVIVASSFTARSLRFAGCPENRITVIPYGCGMGLPSAGNSDRKSRIGRPFFLFVGSGAHRKGLHHLLEAWAQSSLVATHELVIIARVIDSELRDMVASAKSVRHIAGVSGAELREWYESAVAFVLPSLSEGFGHVYLEALACGCPVIGTRNSMLPDLAEAQEHIRYVEPGNPESIRSEMERVASLGPKDVFFRTDRLREMAKHWTLKRFRDNLESVLARFDR
jgi:glycosyltransferase involved in cell wall biosynthesis